MSIKVKYEKENRCLLWHRWKIIQDTGKTKYKECVDCGARMAEYNGEGYQPISYEWVTGRRDALAGID